MARIVGVDLPKNKRGEIGLTYIYGIGRSTARKILDMAGIDYNTKVDAWTDEQVVGDGNPQGVADGLHTEDAKERRVHDDVAVVGYIGVVFFLT